MLCFSETQAGHFVQMLTRKMDHSSSLWGMFVMVILYGDISLDLDSVRLFRVRCACHSIVHVAFG